MATTTVHSPPARVAQLALVAVVVVLTAWVAWETAVAFSHGVQHLPIFRWKVRGGTASGLEVLFGTAGLSFGIAAIASVLFPRLLRDDRGLPG